MKYHTYMGTVAEYRISVLFFPLCGIASEFIFVVICQTFVTESKRKKKTMAPITKNASKSNVKQQVKSIKATKYSTKLRSANVVTPSKDNNSKKNGNLRQAENLESNKNQVRIFQYHTMYVKLSCIFMCIVFFGFLNFCCTSSYSVVDVYYIPWVQ